MFSTITLGISLLDCIDARPGSIKLKIFTRKITTVAKDLVATGQQIEREYGIPIVNKRISITPIAFDRRCGMQMSPKDYVSNSKNTG